MTTAFSRGFFTNPINFSDVVKGGVTGPVYEPAGMFPSFMSYGSRKEVGGVSGHNAGTRIYRRSA